MRVVSTAVAAKIGFMILLTQGVAANAAEIAAQSELERDLVAGRALELRPEFLSSAQ
jgi:hypothetical protein